MTDDINGTVITLSELVASSSETLYAVVYVLTSDRDAAQPVPPALGADGLLGNLSPALLSIGRALHGPSMPDVCPAAAIGHLDQAVDMIGRAGTAITTAREAMAAGGQRAGPAREFPGTVTPRQTSPSGPGANPPRPVTDHDVNGTAMALSELVASSSETLYKVQHGLSGRGPGRPVADVPGAADLLDQLSRAVVFIRGTIVGSSIPEVCPAAVTPYLHQAADHLNDAFKAIRKAAIATGVGFPSRDFPAALAPRAGTDAAAPPRASRQAGPPAARRTP